MPPRLCFYTASAVLLCAGLMFGQGGLLITGCAILAASFSLRRA